MSAQSHKTIMTTTPKCVFGETAYNPGGTFKSAKHISYQVVILQKGSATVHVNQSTYPLRIGEIFFLKPAQNIQYTFDPDKPTHHTWCAIEAVCFSSKLCAKLNEVPFILPDNTRITKLIEQGLGLDGSHTSIHDLLLENLASTVIYEVLNAHEQSRDRSQNRSLYDALDFIMDHYSESLTADKISDCVGLSRQHMNRLFKRKYDTTTSQYLWNYRIEKAHSMIIETGLSLGEIAEKTGFANAFHLSRKIKQAHGQSPQQMRGNKPKMRN